MTGYRVGRGRADITGEAAACGMLGYGMKFQQSDGIHLRLRARAFVVDDGSRRLLLVICELPLMFDNIVAAVLDRLSSSYGDLYTERNSMITATHTHCGPGGYAHYRLYNSNTRGFRPRTHDSIVAGIVEAVDRAHADLAPAQLSLAFAELKDASVNRSRVAFGRNPEAERAAFPDAVDPQVTVLRVDRANGRDAAITWFATHGTSLTNRQTLISGDNKGYAAYHWERLVEGCDYLQPSNEDFVAAFAQTNAGDMSPNLNQRPGSGPTEDEFENTRIIGRRQYDAAASADPTLGEEVSGPLDARIVWVNLGAIDVRPEFAPDAQPHRTSRPCAGAAALAGTDEGPGFPGFHQERNPVLDFVSRRIVFALSSRLRDAQAPKGMTLPAAALNWLVPMVGESYPVQLLRIGPLYLIGVPGEVTIVAGLRLRRAVAEIVGSDVQHVLVAGYSNGYFHYVTTPEEYTAQRYEGGSTLFGRWQLPALTQIVTSLAEAMRDGRDLAMGSHAPTVSRPRAARDRRVDAAPDGRGLGDVVREPDVSYRPGQQVVAEFAGAHLSNDVRRGGTFLLVEREADGGWTSVADDGDWSTKLRWRRSDDVSTVTISWDVPDDVVAGRYRIRYFGNARDASGGVRQIEGRTRLFSVTAQNL